MFRMTCGDKDMALALGRLETDTPYSDIEHPKDSLLLDVLPDLAQMFLIQQGEEPKISKIDVTFYALRIRDSDGLAVLDLSAAFDALVHCHEDGLVTTDDLRKMAETSSMRDTFQQARVAGSSLDGATHSTVALSVRVKGTDLVLAESADMSPEPKKRDWLGRLFGRSG